MRRLSSVLRANRKLWPRTDYRTFIRENSRARPAAPQSELQRLREAA